MIFEISLSMAQPPCAKLALHVKVKSPFLVMERKACMLANTSMLRNNIRAVAIRSAGLLTRSLMLSLLRHTSLSCILDSSLYIANNSLDVKLVIIEINMDVKLIQLSFPKYTALRL